MTRVLITGAGGQLGRELVRADWGPGATLEAFGRDSLDITDETAVHSTVESVEPDLIVNAAAYTSVDRAESEPDRATAVNVDGVANIAASANDVGARLVHISTDYVFDGTKQGWYVETDPIAPLGVYGRTKAAGEDRARDATRHLILRTAWVYGALGGNFVATMRRLSATKPDLAVVDDQLGCPTAAADIASAICDLASRPRRDELSGTYHLASPAATSWYEFAQFILADRIENGFELRAISTSEYPTPALRPANSRLDSNALAMESGIRLPNWHDSVPSVIAELERGANGWD